MTDKQLKACKALDARYLSGELTAAEYTRLHDIARGPVNPSFACDTCMEDGHRLSFQVRVF